MYNDFGQRPPEEMKKYVNEKVGDLPMSEKLSFKNADSLLVDFIGNVSYLTARAYDESVCPKIGSFLKSYE